MQIEKIDHFVLTVKSIEASLHFYHDLLGLPVIQSQSRVAVRVGDEKINLHEQAHDFDPKATVPTPGSADFCLVVREPVADLKKQLENQGLTILEGPEKKHGAQGPIDSIYLRDPDQNLVELANY
ncbi:VOC family protein [Lactobacillaceae bacterium L1_55_11]|nr:VOC family protein [Lactobacillaceae bacterium L1_55_11]